MPIETKRARASAITVGGARAAARGSDAAEPLVAYRQYLGRAHEVVLFGFGYSIIPPAGPACNEFPLPRKGNAAQGKYCMTDGAWPWLMALA